MPNRASPHRSFIPHPAVRDPLTTALTQALRAHYKLLDTTSDVIEDGGLPRSGLDGEQRRLVLAVTACQHAATKAPSGVHLNQLHDDLSDLVAFVEGGHDGDVLPPAIRQSVMRLRTLLRDLDEVQGALANTGGGRPASRPTDAAGAVEPMRR